jgi:predicted ATPase
MGDNDHVYGQSSEVSFDGDSQSGGGGARYPSFSSNRLMGQAGGEDGGESTISGESDVSSEWKSSLIRSSLGSQGGSVGNGRLRFSSLGLYGREKEQKVLHECLQRAMVVAPTAPKPASLQLELSNRTRQPQNAADGHAASSSSSQKNSRQLIFLSGTPGSGKTALASTLIPTVRRHSGVYARGKYDVYLRDEPYAGIASACREICGEILLRDFASSSNLQRSSSGSIRSIQSLSSNSDPGRQKGFTFEEIRSAIVEQLGSELGLLTQVIPYLEEVLGSTVTTHGIISEGGRLREAGQPDDGGVFEAINRLHYAFRRFIRVVATFFNPLVLVLDDLQ